MAVSALRSCASRVLRSASAVACKPVSSGSHVLRIDGYSHLKDVIRHGKGVSSSDFPASGHVWRLLYYPNSNSEFKDHVAVYLQLASDPADELVPARPWFSLLDQLGNPAGVTERDPGMHNFSRGNWWGLYDFISRNELEESEYIKDDRFAIQCAVSVTTIRKCSDHWVFISQNPESNAA